MFDMTCSEADHELVNDVMEAETTVSFYSLLSPTQHVLILF